MNAVVASGVPAADFARGFDTAWVDFTKGLGAPVGAVLAASRELIDEAWRYKQMMGGAMRQAGIAGGRRRCTRSTTTSSGWPTTTPTRAASPRGWPDLPGVEHRRGPRRDEHRHLRASPTRTSCAAALCERRCPARAARPAAAARGHAPRRGRRRHRPRARRCFVRSWRPRRLKRPAHELRRHEQDEAGKPDLQRCAARRCWRPRRRPPRRAATATRSTSPSREPHVAVAVLAPGADDRHRDDRDAATSPPPRSGTGPRKIASAGTNRMPPPTPIRPATAPARKPEHDRGELAHPISSSIATTTSMAGEQQRDRASRTGAAEAHVPPITPATAGRPTSRPFADVDVAVGAMCATAATRDQTIAASEVPVASCSG